MPFQIEKRRAFCIFEYVYFARPDSQIAGVNVYQSRIEMGRQLAKEHPIEADMVVPVPDSGNYAALGYSLESKKIPYHMAFVRNHYVGEAFAALSGNAQHGCAGQAQPGPQSG